MTIRRRLMALTLPAALCATPAAAETTAPTDDDGPTVALSIGTGLRINTTGAIDLAEVAGEADYGSGDDTGPASLGLVLTLGVLVDRWEIMGEAAVNIGGLDLGGIEERYYDSDPASVGGTSTAWLMGAVRHLFRLAPDVELAAGLGAGYMVMGASSPVGGAFYRAVSLGPEAEIRYRVTDADGPDDLGGGWFGFGLDGRLLLPVVARVGTDDAPVFELDGVGSASWLAGASVHYRYDWR